MGEEETRETTVNALIEFGYVTTRTRFIAVRGKTYGKKIQKYRVKKWPDIGLRGPLCVRALRGGIFFVIIRRLRLFNIRRSAPDSLGIDPKCHISRGYPCPAVMASAGAKRSGIGPKRSDARDFRASYNRKKI